MDWGGMIDWEEEGGEEDKGRSERRRSIVI
jgi:hypothetical protein